MRNLKKIVPPEILVNNSINWTKEYIRAKKNNELTDTHKFRYRHPDIKKALKEETGSKCIYCESKIGHNTPGDIEHIKPKSKNDRLYFCWHNLTIACTECNRRKNAYDDNKSPFLNPYVDDVEACIIHAGPLTFHLTGNDQAEVSIRLLEINNLEKRPELIGRKIDKLFEIKNLVDRYNIVTNTALKNLLKKDLLRMAEPTQEYSAMVSAFLRLVQIL